MQKIRLNQSLIFTMTCPILWHALHLQIYHQVLISTCLFLSAAIMIGVPSTLSFVPCVQLVLKYKNTIELDGLITIFY
jgi:hypothetical protein